MFDIFYMTAVLQNVISMSIFFLLLQLVLPANEALVLSVLMTVVAAAACFLCRLKLKTYLYRLISFALSVLLAGIIAKISIAAVILALLFLYVFTRVRSTVVFRKDISVQLSVLAIIMNIFMALMYYSTTLRSIAVQGNVTIVISTIGAVIVLVLKQVDDSRRFGKNNMDISRVQKKNNRIFTGVILFLLLIVSSVGHVSSIYKFVLGLIAKVIGLFMDLLYMLMRNKGSGPQGPAMPDIVAGEPGRQTLFDKIINILVYAVAIAVLAASIGYVLYKLAKFIVNLIRKLINWLKTGQQAVDTITEFGHTDEKQSILADSLRNFAQGFYNRAAGLFAREIPYHKLPDDISKVRRLFKYFRNKTKRAGVNTGYSLTAQELCREAGDAEPGSEPFNGLMARCYDSARYGDAAPTPEELRKLEEKLLK